MKASKLFCLIALFLIPGLAFAGPVIQKGGGGTIIGSVSDGPSINTSHRGWQFLKTVSTGTLVLAIKDGSAAVYATDLNLSGYTANMIIIIDSAGKMAVAYGYQAGEGEHYE